MFEFIDPKADHSATPDLLDFSSAALLLGYLGRLLSRRRMLVGIVFVATLLPVPIALLTLPKVYRVESRIFTLGAYGMRSLVGRNLYSHRPTVGAKELLKSRANLDWIVRSAGLVDSWRENRSPIGRLKDDIRELFMEPGTDEALRFLLEKRLWVKTDGPVVQIDVEWRNRHAAFDIAKLATARFLDTRRQTELTELEASIEILRAQLTTAAAQLTESEEYNRELLIRQFELENSSAQAERAWIAGVMGRQRRVAARVRTPSRAQRELEDIDRLVDRARESHEAAQLRASSALSSLRVSLGPGHPDVERARENLESHASVPGELTTLLSEQRRLQAKTGPAGRRGSVASAPPMGMPRPTFRKFKNAAPAARQTHSLESSELELRKLRESYRDLEDQIRETGSGGCGGRRLQRTVHGDHSSRASARTPLRPAQRAEDERSGTDPGGGPVHPRQTGPDRRSGGAGTPIGPSPRSSTTSRSQVTSTSSSGPRKASIGSSSSSTTPKGRDRLSRSSASRLTTFLAASRAGPLLSTSTPCRSGPTRSPRTSTSVGGP